MKKLYCSIVTYHSRYQNTYDVPAPPKDYDLADTGLDVNRNDDSTYDSGVPTASDQSGNAKNHKKLERLVKKSTTQKSPGRQFSLNFRCITSSD